MKKFILNIFIILVTVTIVTLTISYKDKDYEEYEEGDIIPPTPIKDVPEWVTTAYMQENVVQGPVSTHPTLGLIESSATQTVPGLRPTRTGQRDGIEFAANSGQFLMMPGKRDAQWNYRWCIFTFRIDSTSGNNQQTILLDINNGNAPNRSSPKIWYDKQSGLNIQYVGRNKEGLDRRVMTTPNIVADGKNWNVVVCGIRYGQMFASVNGVPLTTQIPQPPRFSGELPAGNFISYLGDSNTGNMAWAYDALVFGQTEPSEALVCKMTSWAAHRCGFADRLPESHPYRTDSPVIDYEDFLSLFVLDYQLWQAWGSSLSRKITMVNSGGPRVEPQGFERVFYDDFRADRVKASTSGEGDLWMGPGFNPAVGVDAPLVAPGQQPNAYPYDELNQNQILSLAPQGNKWRGSAIYTVNDLGQGYTWKGPKIFRIRSMFPAISPAGGLFLGFWSYGIDSNLLWRTRNRIEVDYFEPDGKYGSYLNGLSSHYHNKANINNDIYTKSYPHYKVYGGELTEAKTGIPGGFFFWDGQFHTWEYVIDQEMTYVNLTITGENDQEKWVEVFRCPTSPMYLERLDLQLDYALRTKDGVPPAGIRQDWVIDFIEVLQKTSDIEKLPEPFLARPSITTVGNKIMCQPNLDGITDVRYYWFADGYPLTYGPDSTYTLTAADVGKPIRCMVKAVGARDMPEAWSNTIN